jgi:hypothetical protein
MTMKTQSKRQWIVSITKDERVAWGIESITLRFLHGEAADAAEDLAYEVRHQTTDETIRFMAAKCKTLRDETGKTDYFHLGYERSEFSMAAQRNVDGSHNGRWYALHLTEGSLTHATVAAFRKLVGIDEPEPAIAALKAIFVRYLPAAKEYVRCDRPAFLDKTVSAQNAVPASAETAMASGESH